MTVGAGKTFSTIFSECSYNVEQYVRFFAHARSTQSDDQALTKGHHAMPETPIHLDFIKQQLPHWLRSTSLQRFAALKLHQPDFVDLHHHPPAAAKPFKRAVNRHWANQNALEQTLAKLNDLRAFAEPLLKNALRDYGNIDVRGTSIRLYAPAKLPWWSISVQPGVTSRTTTLLEAALHNFSAAETFADYAFLSAADARGQRQLLTFVHQASGQRLTADIFKAICRDLDIGSRYRQHLTQTLGFDNASVALPLRETVIASLKAGLDAAAHIALARKEIAADSHALIQTLLQRDGPLKLGRQTVDLYTLDLLGTRLTGILVIAPTQLDARPNRILVYIPEDPHHPLKEYPSSHAFINELTGQLRDRTPPTDASRPSYQQFFSQFVAHKERGRFFSQLNTLLSTVRWHAKPAGDNRPNWRPDPVEAPNLQFRTQAMRDDTQNRINDPNQNNLWHYLYRVKLNQLLNDAQEIAIATDYADRMARWAWWDNLEKMLTDIFNAALLVATPFVPVLGELMLAYTAYQMLDDVFEGIVDWAEGLQREGWDHVLSVADNVLQLALFHAGGGIGEIAKVKLSPFVERLKPVQTPLGETRLWNPDLTPYQQLHLRLPRGQVAQENGLHHHQGKQIAKLENQRYEVRHDPTTQTFHLAHPKRANAYRPAVALNGSGACVIEGEQPRTWNNTRLLRRLGPQTHGLTAGELEQVRLISGVEFGTLRHMYLNNEPTPPLLADTLKRFNSDKQISNAIDTLHAGQRLDPAADWFEQMITELDGWPRDKALLVYPQSDLSGAPRRYGNAKAQGADTLSLSIHEVMSGRLAEKVVGFLDEEQLARLLGKQLPEEARVQALREHLAAYVEQQSAPLAHDVYARQESSNDPNIQLLRSHYPDLPLSLAQHLVRHTRRRHLRVMNAEQRLPLDVKNQARELDFEAASSRMFEQIFYAKAPSAHTENLALNTLRIYSDSLANLRIQVRERTYWGELRTQVGAEDAAHVRILVRNRKGLYRVFAPQGDLIHGATDFYSALFQALPAEKPFADGDKLRAWLSEKTAAPATRRLTLSGPPIPARTPTETLTLLGGGNSSSLRGVEVTPVTLRGRIKHWLPQMSEQGVKHFALSAETPEGLAQLEHIEREGKTLERALDAYVNAPTPWPAHSRLEAVTRNVRTRLARKLKAAWRDSYTKLHDTYGPTDKNVILDLSEVEWSHELPTLPINMTHVTHLYMNDCAFTSQHNAFLQRFPNLKELDLSDNHLDALPEPIATMRQLRAINLSGNQIVLDDTAVDRLRQLSRLRLIYLADNPLGRAPDISRMPELDEIDLSRTGINEWPVGLFAQERGVLFHLHLTGNPISTIPDVALRSDEAFILVYTRLDRATLSAQARDLWDEHKIAFGMDPYRTYPPKGESDFWVADLDDDHRKRFETLWDELEDEHGSQGFFEVIKKLEPPEFFEDPADELRYERNRQILTSQVRYMLSSMHNDAPLRQLLFRLSSFPGLCPDAGSQIFTEMGIQVTAHQAQLYSRTPAEREDRLVKLARGAAHLKLLNDVVRADIADRLKPVDQGGRGLRLTSHVVNGEPGSVDEVGVYLAYQTRLSNRLELPWVSDNMVYRDTANVPKAAIAQAYTAVKTLSEGDGLVNQILLEPYWEAFLKERYAHDYQANEDRSDQQFLLLDQLHSEQQAYAQASDETQKAQQRAALKSLVEQLQIEDRVVPDQVMSEALYDQIYNDLAERRKEWLREQTRLSLARLEA